MRGINAMDSLSGMDPQDAIFSYNLYPAQYGLRVRDGYIEFATNVGTDGGRTIIPFTGSTSSASKLFACAEDGIYDISAGGAGAWSDDITFATQNSTSGYGQWQNFTTLAGHYVIYCDEANGYFNYTEGGAWAQVAFGVAAGEVSGVDPEDLVSVCVFKSRLWFVEKDSASAWYLDAGAIAGVATEFNFGNKFKRGGYLVNLFTWTVDGGEGVDDYLVAVSSSGDVILYRGNDPDVATDWFQHGSWFIGRPPAGRRIGGSFGGELYLLSSYGVIPLSRLLAGKTIQDPETFLTRRITPLVEQEIRESAGLLGWEIKLITSPNLLMLAVPEQTSQDQIQFVQSLNTTGWGIYRDLPYFTGDEWDGSFYFSDGAGTVYTHEGSLDNVSLDSTTYDNILFSVLTSFQEYPPPGQWKRAQYIRPSFISESEPGFSVSARFDYRLEENLGSVSPGIAAGSLWDAAIWDSDLWSTQFTVTDRPVGAMGYGFVVAIALNGAANTTTTLVGFDLMLDSGGLL
jgi:hypothetical protein